jgi:hypothetical protein
MPNFFFDKRYRKIKKKKKKKKRKEKRVDIVDCSGDIDIPFVGMEPLPTL